MVNIKPVTHDIRVNPDHVLVGPRKDVEVGHQEVGELFFQLTAQIFTQLQHLGRLLLAYNNLDQTSIGPIFTSSLSYLGSRSLLIGPELAGYWSLTTSACSSFLSFLVVQRELL